MTDRELLEFAAKAAGYKKYYTHYLGRDSFVTYDDEYYSEVKERRVVGEKTLDWNPLTDDGDALRLMVRLRLEPRFIDNSHSNGAEPSRVTLHNFAGIVENIGDDPYAATRRAIVRAAAEIGRQMT